MATEALTIYIKEKTQSQSNPQKIVIREKATQPLQRESERISLATKFLGAGAGLAKLALNNDVISRIGEYKGNQNQQIQINNVRKVGNSLLNIGIGTLVNPSVGVGVALAEGYSAVKGSLDYINGIRKDDIRASYKLDASNGILINNSIYKKEG